jgi:hypothetical protein
MVSLRSGVRKVELRASDITPESLVIVGRDTFAFSSVSLSGEAIAKEFWTYPARNTLCGYLASIACGRLMLFGFHATAGALDGTV